MNAYAKMAQDTQKKAGFWGNLMPKWHKAYAKMAQPKCLYVEFFATSGKTARKRRKKGLCPLLGMVWQQAATMGFPHLAGEPSTLVSMALATVHLSDWGVVQKCTLQPCALVCMTNKPFPPLLGEHRNKLRWGNRRDYAHKWARSSPVHRGNCCSQLQRTDSLYKMPEHPHATGSDLACCGTPDSTKCTRQPRRLDDKAPPPAHRRKNLIPTGVGNFFHL